MTSKYQKALVPLTEANLKRIVKGHDAAGYGMISASRQSLPESENITRTQELKYTLKKLGYSYIPVYGGYKEEGQEKAGLELSLIVYPYDIVSKTYADFDQFIDDLLDLGNKFNQDSILIKEPNDKPKYIECKTGNVMVSFDSHKLNDVDSDYFTALKKWSDMSLNKKEQKWDKGSPQRFTFEAYIEEQPNQFASGCARKHLGEFVVPGFRGV